MPKLAKELTALHVKRLTQPGLHAVGGVSGLCLYVKPSGSRSWVLRTAVAGERRHIGLGGYPTVTLEGARDKARGALAEIESGTDPVAKRAELRQAAIAERAKLVTFGQARADYFAQKSGEFRSAKHKRKWQQEMTNHCSALDRLIVGAVALPDVLKVIEPIWLTKPVLASRIRGRIEAVLSWCTVKGFRTGENPARWTGNLEHLLAAPSKIKHANGGVKHHAALAVADMPAFMTALREREDAGARAVELAVLCTLRTNEVRGALWSEIDLERKLWTIPAARMKMARDHAVPLSEQAVELLSALPHSSHKVFDLGENSMRNAVKAVGFGGTPHGIARSTFKDWARTLTQYADEVSELCLAHVDSSATRAAYARDGLLELRREMLQSWADYLDKTTTE